tara:strand:- start:656 stop:940 length:285 start_codon:yes stop_codon:yes gene_type:complete
MRYYVYLILTKFKNKYLSYVGYTKNLQKRIKDHNSSKGAKYTKGKKWILIYKKPYKTKSEALKKEYVLKKNIKLRNFIKRSYINKNENIDFTSL